MRKERLWLVAPIVATVAVLLLALIVSKGPSPQSGFSYRVDQLRGSGPGQRGGAGVGAEGTTQLRGAQLHPLWWDETTADFDQELDLLKNAGANTVRFDISWSSLETDGKGKFSSWYVTKADLFLQHAQDRGLKIIGTLWATPCWASSAPDTLKQGCTGSWWDRGVDRYAPANVNDYADAAAWVAQRWGSRLTALEIWNEPNLSDKYSLQADDPAAVDAALLKAAYPRVKAIAPDLTVLGGVLAFADGDFLEQLYADGIHGSFDGLSIHPYNEWRAPDDPWQTQWRKYTFITGVPWVQSILQAHGDGDKGLWLTEFGWSTCGTGGSWCVTPDQQAQYVARGLAIAAGWPYVKAAVIYNLRNKGSDPTDRESQFGIVNRDFTLKPAYAAFQTALSAPASGGSSGTTTTPVQTGTSTTPVQTGTSTTPVQTGTSTTRGSTGTTTTRSPTGTTTAPSGGQAPAATGGSPPPDSPDVNQPPPSAAPTAAAPLPFGVSFGRLRVVTGLRPAVSIPLRCSPGAVRTCNGRLVLTLPSGTVLAAARLSARRGPFVVRPLLTAAGRKALRHARPRRIVATVVAARGVRIARVSR